LLDAPIYLAVTLARIGSTILERATKTGTSYGGGEIYVFPSNTLNKGHHLCIFSLRGTNPGDETQSLRGIGVYAYLASARRVGCIINAREPSHQ
jgi:hypothetical protein